MPARAGWEVCYRRKHTLGPSSPAPGGARKRAIEGTAWGGGSRPGRRTVTSPRQGQTAPSSRPGALLPGSPRGAAGGEPWTRVSVGPRQRHRTVCGVSRPALLAALRAPSTPSLGARAVRDSAHVAEAACAPRLPLCRARERGDGRVGQEPDGPAARGQEKAAWGRSVRGQAEGAALSSDQTPPSPGLGNMAAPVPGARRHAAGHGPRQP